MGRRRRPDRHHHENGSRKLSHSSRNVHTSEPKLENSARHPQCGGASQPPNSLRPSENGRRIHHIPNNSPLPSAPLGREFKWNVLVLRGYRRAINRIDPRDHLKRILKGQGDSPTSPIGPEIRRRVNGRDWRPGTCPETATARTVLIRRGVRSPMISVLALSSFCKGLHAQKRTRKRIKNALNRS